MSPEQINKIADSFAYEYVGGGHFRKKGIKKGESAETKHGKEIIDEVIKHVIISLEQTNN